jgi:WD40 repeat protein
LSDNPYILKMDFGVEKELAFRSIDFSPNGEFLVSSGKNDPTAGGGVRFWKLDKHNLLENKGLEGLSAHKIRYSPDGNWIAFLNYSESNIFIWDIPTAQYSTLKKHSAKVCSIAVSPKGNMLASGDVNNELNIWDIETRKAKSIRRDEDNYGNGVLSVAFTPDGHLLASGESDNAVRFWDVETGQQQFVIELANFQYTRPVHDIVFSPNGQIMAVATNEAEIQIWDWQEKNKLQSFYPDRPTHSSAKMAFSPDGSLFAGGTQGNLRLWGIGDIANGNTGYNLKIPDCFNVTDVVFSPNGNLLASAHGEEARLWKVRIL